VSVKTLRRRITDGTITGYRIGRLVRVDLDELSQRLAVAIPTARSMNPRPIDRVSRPRSPSNDDV
jgi:excisionase family DNA binding protein